MRATGACSHYPTRGGASLLALIVVAILVLILARIFASFLGTEDAAERDKVSLQALAQAKAGLIAYAVSVQPDTYAKRPGELPCPDLDNDGDAEITCFSANQRIGRLPWKTLRLPDLRDGHGERLWYALSATFQRKTFNQCPTPGGPACLNSDTRGTLTVRNSGGVVVSDSSSAAGGAVAVLLAPGPVLTRLGKKEPQDRSCAGDANLQKCEQSGVCTGPSSARCQAINYLDIAGPPALSIRDARDSTEDNADFSDSGRDNGLIAGPIRDREGNTVVNDILMAITYQDLMPLLEQRVAGEALKCLRDYAAQGTGRYPWAAPVNADFREALSDLRGQRWGRLPQVLAGTKETNAAMSTTWPSDCPVSMDVSKKAWWANWKDQVFFALAPGFGPDAASPSCSGGCLTVNPPSPEPGKHVVVLVAGRTLATQARGVGAQASNYLEASNISGGTRFEHTPATMSFNDVVVFE
jgi:type II secretory pathway pseudopilin PulG